MEKAHEAAPKERGNRLKQLRKMAKLTRIELGKLVGNAASTIQYWEIGESQGLPQHEAEKLSETFQRIGIHCSSKWLYQGIGDKPVYIPLANQALEATSSTTMEEVKLFHQLHTDAITLQIKDDIMLPFYGPNEWIGGIKQYASRIIELNNQVCIVELETTEVLCRVLKLANRKKHYELRGINASSNSSPFFIDSVKLISAAKIIRHWINEL